MKLIKTINIILNNRIMDNLVNKLRRLLTNTQISNYNHNYIIIRIFVIYNDTIFNVHKNYKHYIKIYNKIKNINKDKQILKYI